MKCRPATVTLIAALSSLPLNSSSGPESYATPDAAMSAFLAAVSSETDALMASVLGIPMVQAMRDDTVGRQWPEGLLCLRTAIPNQVRLQVRNSNRLILYIGTVDPFALELFHTEAGWRFDDAAGIRELAKRRVCRNQQAAIAMCRRYVEAQWDYSNAHRKDGQRIFAQRISSLPGRRDGLFWSDPAAAEESPMGPRFARAAFDEQSSQERPQPYFGYYFKLLLRQGPDAPGGALDYRVDGRLVNGFALLAWPAEYGVTGVASYLVDQLGGIYQKDLGPETHRSALSMAEFNPDTSWIKLESGLDEN